jgi:tRNA pseudouridine13 synthase
LVNEITPSGEVVHLRNTRAPFSSSNEAATVTEKKEPVQATEQPAQKEEATETPEAATPAEFKVSEEDNALLVEYFGAENAAAIVTLHETAMNSPRARPSELGKVTVVVSDRDLRTKIHQAIRRIFNSQLESSADGEGTLAITAASNRFKRKAQGHRGNTGRGSGGGGRVSWDELGGPYLHFTIYKENKDTMEVISYLARTMKMNPKTFQFAGTKDRRGVTAQRACVLRVQAERLANMNKSLRNASLGDFEYRKHGLELGDLGGNEFVITLRDCEFPGVDMTDPQAAVSKASEIVGTSLKKLHDRGYFNYYGLQRFGTFLTRTDTIGVKMLQDDFKGAAEAILHYSPHVLAAAQEGESSTALISTDDKARAEAIYIFQSTNNVNDALAKLPRKFSAEANIIRHLGRVKNDYLGAIMSIPRNLRLIYVHAYQSLVWNFAASERWRLYGDKVVEGDLVIVSEHRDKEEIDGADANSGVDEDGEVVVLPQGENSSYAAEDAFTRARALTADEAASGKYTIFDVVLPQPGFDVLYPANQMTEFYKKFMASEQGGGLDPFNMRRKNKDTSLSGGYRKLFSRMGSDFSHEVKLYSEDNEQFVQTDMEKLKGSNEGGSAAAQTGDKLAVVLKFQLGSSQYATMALRELTKGKVREYKPDLGGGR